MIIDCKGRVGVMGDSEGLLVSGGISYYGLGMDWEVDRLEENVRRSVFSMVDCEGCRNEI